MGTIWPNHYEAYILSPEKIIYIWHHVFVSQVSFVLNDSRLDSLASVSFLNSHSYESDDKEDTFLKFTIFVNLSGIFVLVLGSPSRREIDFGIDFYFLSSTYLLSSLVTDH